MVMHVQSANCVQLQLDCTHCVTQVTMTMIPDSTQDVRKELAPTSRTAKERNISMAKDMKGKKRKSKELLKKKGTKRKKAEQTRATESPGCDAAEMDLQVELKPISDYVGDRTELVEQMMTTITMPQIRRMLPDILKDIPGDKLKQLCNDQLDMMSKKRILCILKGENADDISSSGTDDGDDEDVKELGQEQDSVQPADSTSSLLDEPHSAEKKLSTTNDNDQLELNPDQDEVGSLYDEEMDRSVAAKDVELNADTPKEAEVEKLDVKPEKEIPSHHQEEERIPRHLPTTAPPTTEDASLGHAALSSFTKNQMEILELEMRARAIKAMLNAQVRQSGTPQSQPQEQKVEEEVEQEEWDEDEEQEDIAYRIDDQCQARTQEEDEVIAKPLSPPAPVVTRYKRGVDSEPEEGELTDQSEDDGEQVDDNVESNKPESTIQVSSPTKVEERQIKREGDPAVALSAADASDIVTAPADSTRSGSLPAVTSSDDGEERAIGETLCALVDAVAASIDCHRVAETNADDGAGACSTHAAIARGSSMRAPCRLAVTLYKLAVTLCKLAVTLYKLAVTLCKLAVMLCKLAVTLCKLAVTLYKLAVTLCKLAVTLCKLAVTLYKLAVTLCGLAVTLCKLVMTLYKLAVRKMVTVATRSCVLARNVGRTTADCTRIHTPEAKQSQCGQWNTRRSRMLTTLTQDSGVKVPSPMSRNWMPKKVERTVPDGELTDQSEDDGEQVDDNVESNKPESTIQVSSPTKVEERQIKREGDPAVALSAADASAIVTAPADSTRSGSLPAVTSSDDGEERAIGETLCALVDAVAASIDCHRVAETNADDGAGACSTHAAIARGSSMRAPCSHDPSHMRAVRVEAVSTRQNVGQDGNDGRQAGASDTVASWQ
ncbi:PREDICTED: uncharacterized protein LOC106805968 [Priapulus caudatus]|uniref:Uncharacterized protein LOC106805968 n=1 Tax=Priapulus caudatus TaxID=37621 RepID=A0ABM1DTJ2_PRICU|nr:PREDICTED: uncharacterized protein LOC106805968 [Priapulus caudatus]